MVVIDYLLTLLPEGGLLSDTHLQNNKEGVQVSLQGMVGGYMEPTLGGTVSTPPPCKSTYS